MKRALASCLLLVALLPTVAAQGAIGFTHEPDYLLAGQAVTFTAQAPDSSPRNWTWDFGDQENGTGPVVQHTFRAPGTYYVKLTSDDGSIAGDLVTVYAPQGLDFLPRWLFWAMPLLVGSILITLAYMVLQRGQPVIYNLVYFLLYVAIGLKGITESFAVLTQGNASHPVFLEINEAIAYVAPCLFLWFVLVFPRPVLPWLHEGRRGILALGLAIPFLANQVLGWIAFESALNYFNGFVSVLALACLGLIVYHAWEIDSEEERTRIRLLAITFAIIVVSTIVLMLLNLAQAYYLRAGDHGAVAGLERAAAVFGLVLVPIFEIAGALLMLYAILRYQLLGIQSLVVKMTRGAVAALMVPATFIIVGNIIEEVFQNLVLEGSNLRFDFIIAGFVAAFAMAPIQKFTTFLMNKFLPALSSADESARRVEIYSTQLRYSLLDGALNDREVSVLSHLAEELKLKPEELDQVRAAFPRANLAGLRVGAAPAAA